MTTKSINWGCYSDKMYTLKLTILQHQQQLSVLFLQKMRIFFIILKDQQAPLQSVSPI